MLGTYQEDPANSGEFPAFVKEDKHLYFLKVSLFSSMEAWNIHSTLFTVHCAMCNVQCAMDDTFLAHTVHCAMSDMQDPLHHFEGWTISDDLSSVSSSLNV